MFNFDFQATLLLSGRTIRDWRKQVSSMLSGHAGGPGFNSQDCRRKEKEEQKRRGKERKEKKEEKFHWPFFTPLFSWICTNLSDSKTFLIVTSFLGCECLFEAGRLSFFKFTL